MYDAIRIAAILLSAIVCAFMPSAVGVRNRPKRVWALLVCVELYVFSSMVALGYHIGDEESPPWYRTPLLFIASVAGIVHIGLAIRHYINNTDENKGSYWNGN